MEIEAPGTATEASRTLRTGSLAALGLLTTASVTLSVLGIGTGDGPLGPPGGDEVGISRDVGDEFTEGNTILTNHGWFAAHIESIRPLPVDGAATGLHITAVELAPLSTTPIGIVDGDGDEFVAREVRSSPEGYEIPPQRLAGRPGTAEVLVRAKIERPGGWSYRGYEVVYRAGLVRHRMVVGPELQACTPGGGACLDTGR